MLEEQLLAEFAETIKAEAADKRAELPPDTPLPEDTALGEVFLGYLEEAGLVASHDLCPHEDKGGHRPCRVIAYSLPEDTSRLEVFTAHAKGSSEEGPLPRKELARLSGWAARFFEYAAKSDFSRFSGNELAAAAAKLIRHQLDHIEEVRVHVLTDAVVCDRGVDDITVLDRPIETEVWDLERLHRAVGEEVTRERIEIDFEKLMGRPLACLEMKPPPKEYQTFLVVLPGNLIFQLYEQYGARLFEFNVRSFLQVKGAVNKGIRKTIEEQPGRFLAYNNGITATADEIDVGTWHGETVIRRLKGLQIVNGAQTTASIHRAKKVDKLSIDEVAVPMKLTLVPPTKLQEFVPLIAQFANTQNPIQVADLSASNPFHQQFEDLSEMVWCPGEETRWFYERARGAYEVFRNRQATTPAKRRDFDEKFPKSRCFGKPDLAKYLMTWWGEPHTVSKGAQKNYAAFMVRLSERTGDNWQPDKQFYRETIAKALLFKAAQSAVRKAKLQSYGANVVAYMMAKLAADHGSDLDLDYLWETQEVSPEMSAIFLDWATHIHKTIVETAGTRNVTEWCKKEGCWDAFRTVTLPLPAPLPPEFKDAQPGPTDRPEHEGDETDCIAVCTSLDGPTWAKVLSWAAAGSTIEEYDRKVAHTLSGYAMDGWQKQPSVKQAIRGVRVIAAAREAGILEPAAA